MRERTESPLRLLVYFCICIFSNHERNRMSSKPQTRASWSGKWAFILAAAASAVGLGSLWRFPYLAAKYGGGTFLITYIIMVFTIGISLLLLETALGRKTGLSATSAFKSFGNRYAFIGMLASALPFIILSYYCIIGGWVAKYAVAYMMELPETLADGGTYFTDFITDPITSLFFMLLFMGITYAVVFMGVKNGIEKANMVMMPTLLVMAVCIAGYTLTLPGALDGMAYYLKPDFSKISPELIVATLGQTFYGLSLAMGIMITYGSYLDKKESLTSSVCWIGGMGALVSFLAGMMVVPAAFAAMGSGEAVAQNSGPSLMFIILPEVFANMGAIAPIIGVAFFVLVLFAALTSSISLMETCVSIVHDAVGYSRAKSLVIGAVFVTLFGCFINFGYNGLSFIEPLGPGTTLLDFFDFLSNSVFMPAVALLTCIFVGWILKPQALIDEIEISSEFKLAGAWAIVIKYIAPVFITIILIAFTAQSLGLLTL